MERKEFFKRIARIVTGYVDVTHADDDWFNIRCRGCVFPDELDELRKYCYVSNISFDNGNLLMLISCKFI